MNKLRKAKQRIKDGSSSELQNTSRRDMEVIENSSSSAPIDHTSSAKKHVGSHHDSASVPEASAKSQSGDSKALTGQEKRQRSPAKELLGNRSQFASDSHPERERRFEKVKVEDKTPSSGLSATQSDTFDTSQRQMTSMVQADINKLWSWIPHLRQAADDQTVASAARMVFAFAEQIVNNFYVDRKIRKDRLKHHLKQIDDIDFFHLPVDWPISDLFHDVVQQTLLIKHCLISEILSTISLDCSSKLPSLLPAEFTALAKACRPSLSASNETPHLHAAKSAHRVLTAYIRRNIGEDDDYLRQREDAIDEIVTAIETNFQPWIDSERLTEHRIAALRDLLLKTAELGILLSSQSSTFLFDWSNVPASGTGVSIPIWPRFLKVFDADAQELETAQIMINMKSMQTPLITESFESSSIDTYTYDSGNGLSASYKLGLESVGMETESRYILPSEKIPVASDSSDTEHEQFKPREFHTTSQYNDTASNTEPAELESLERQSRQTGNLSTKDKPSLGQYVIMHPTTSTLLHQPNLRAQTNTALPSELPSDIPVRQIADQKEVPGLQWKGIDSKKLSRKPVPSQTRSPPVENSQIETRGSLAPGKDILNNTHKKTESTLQQRVKPSEKWNQLNSSYQQDSYYRQKTSLSTREQAPYQPIQAWQAQPQQQYQRRTSTYSLDTQHYPNLISPYTYQNVTPISYYTKNETYVNRSSEQAQPYRQIEIDKRQPLRPSHVHRATTLPNSTAFSSSDPGGLPFYPTARPRRGSTSDYYGQSYNHSFAWDQPRFR